jgi:FkbM family methyltransferase
LHIPVDRWQADDVALAVSPRLLRKVRLVRALENWPSVWAAARLRRTIPPLRLRGGMVVEHAPGDVAYDVFHEIFVQRCYLGDGFYRPAAGDVVVDGGAQVGLFALHLQWLAPGIRVHCFEPAPATRARLAANVARNALGATIGIHPYALLDREGTVPLRANTLSGNRSLFERADASADRPDVVRCIPLATALDLCGGERLALLKLDVEGAEVEILEGADEATLARVERVALEYHDFLRPGCRERVAERLTRAGFRHIETEPSAMDGAIGILRAARS